jgi:alginate O-acetyltransferase complex protein AlgI
MVQSIHFWLLLATAVPAYWLLPQRFRAGFLFVASFGYLASLDVFSVLALLGWTLLFFAGMRHAAREPSRGRFIAVALVLGITAFLAYFKYLPPLLHALAGRGGAAVVLVPLGISYFTFKLIHYAIEVRRGTLVDTSLPTFLCYMFLFPIFTAGPIQRYDDFVAQRAARWDASLLADGGTRIAYGLIKKFVFAEFLLLAVYGGGLPTGPEVARQLASYSALHVWALLPIAYLYIYLDFSAYTDIAIGCSRLFGYRIMENFRYPVIASNISDFWRRWHISLSAWCQSYIYLPIMGATRIPYLAALGTFIVIGVWHAASGTRLMWGLFHFTGVAAFMLWTRLRGRRRRAARRRLLPTLGGVLATQVFVSASMAFILAEGAGVGTGFRLLARLFAVEIGP